MRWLRLSRIGLARSVWELWEAGGKQGNGWRRRTHRPPSPTISGVQTHNMELSFRKFQRCFQIVQIRLLKRWEWISPKHIRDGDGGRRVKVVKSNQFQMMILNSLVWFWSDAILFIFFIFVHCLAKFASLLMLAHTLSFIQLLKAFTLHPLCTVITIICLNTSINKILQKSFKYYLNCWKVVTGSCVLFTYHDIIRSQSEEIGWGENSEGNLVTGTLQVVPTLEIQYFHFVMARAVLLSTGCFSHCKLRIEDWGHQEEDLFCPDSFNIQFTPFIKFQQPLNTNCIIRAVTNAMYLYKQHFQTRTHKVLPSSLQNRT